jgi:hypothetical protein
LRGFLVEQLVLDGTNVASIGLFMNLAGNAVVDQVTVIAHLSDGYRITGGIDSTLRNARITNGSVVIAAASTGAVRTSNVVTITTTTAHGLVTSDPVQIRGVTDSSFNGAFLLASAPTTTTFTYAQTAGDATSGAGTAEGGYGINIVGATTTTITFSRLYMTGYHTGLRNSTGVSITSLGNIYETVTNGVHNLNNQFVAINDNFEADTPFVQSYILDSGGTATVIAPGPALANIDHSGTSDKTRLNLITGLDGISSQTVRPLGNPGNLGSATLRYNAFLEAVLASPLQGTVSNISRWVFKQVDFGDMTAASTAATFTLWTFPANTVIHDIMGTVVTGWSGGSISAAVCSVGTNAGSANDLTLDDNFFAAATVYELHDATASGGKGTLLFDSTDKFAPHMFVAGGVVEIQCDLTGDNHANATAGRARVYALVSQPLGNTTTEAN